VNRLIADSDLKDGFSLEVSVCVRRMPSGELSLVLHADSTGLPIARVRVDRAGAIELRRQLDDALGVVTSA
jgi:hypothetical protein